MNRIQTISRILTPPASRRAETSLQCQTYVWVAVDLECGHGAWAQGDLLPAAVETVLGEMGRTDGGAEPRVPAAPTHGLDPLREQRVVVQREPGRTRQ